MGIKSYQIETEQFTHDDFVKLLERQFSGYTIDHQSKGRKEYFDTFDLRLFNKNIIFSKFNNEYLLEEFGKKESDISRQISFKTNKKINIAEDFPAQIREKLKPILDVRSLLPVVSLEEERLKYSFFNKDKKIILRTEVEKFILTDTDNNKSLTINTISLIPLKGYEKKSAKSEELLLKFSPCREIQREELFWKFLEKAKKVPVNYSSKAKPNLNPEMDSYLAVRAILKNLVDIAVINEDGIINEFDTEFLHDYRVALRKSRSILGQLKNVFNTGKIEKYSNDLSEIASKTNNLRDMDVYLMNKAAYCDMLPEHLHQELEVFFRDVKRKKRKEQRLVAALLNSHNYRNTMNAWIDFLKSDEQENKGSESNVPILEIAQKNIYKRFAAILKKGKQLKESSKDADFHKVRINCKKLRYLLELFSGLFPEEEINMLIKQLKNIQDSLGNFNDMSVQEIHLNDYLHSLKGRKIDNTKIAAAIGGLVTSTYNRKMGYRIEFLERFNNFTSAENIKLINELFKKDKQEQ